MAATLTQIRTAIAANLSANLTNIQVSAYMLSSPTPPTIHLYPGGPAGDITYHLAMRDGAMQWPFTVQAFVPLTADQGAQVALDTFLAPTGANSVKAAIESDTTLGGLVGGLKVVSSGGYRAVNVEGHGPAICAEWHVEVLATGT